MRWERRVARTWYFEKKDNLGNLDVDERLKLNWNFKKQGVKLWIGFNWLKLDSIWGLSFENGNELSGSIRGGEFLDQLIKRTL
jgi:hypothetical protein